jgi:hypothetical protein
MKKMTMKSKGMKRGGKMKAKGMAKGGMRGGRKMMMKKGGKAKGGKRGGAMTLASIRAAAKAKGYKLVKA